MAVKFFCDIQGTFDGGTDRKKAISTFVQLLNAFSEEVEFSFISSVDSEEMLKYLEEMAETIVGTNIKLGRQYGSSFYIEKGPNSDYGIVPTVKEKQMQIKEDLAGREFSNIFLADDSHAVHLIVEIFIEKKYLPKITQLLTNGGIDNLNNILEEHLSNRPTK